jgi:hypothetical protein
MGARYSKLMQTSPLFTKTVTAFVLATISNGFANALAGKFQPLSNLKYGMTCAPPYTHFWFILLDKMTKNTILQVILDQLLWRPLLIYYIFVSDGYMKGETSTETKDKLRNVYPTVVVNSWKVWPIVSFLNLSFTPPVMRSVVLDLVSFVWDIYTSTMLMSKTNDDNHAKEGLIKMTPISEKDSKTKVEKKQEQKRVDPINSL